MTYTQTDIDNMKAMLASGQIEYRKGDVMVRYRSVEEAMRVLAMMERDVASAAGTKQARVGLITTSKGL